VQWLEAQRLENGYVERALKQWCLARHEAPIEHLYETIGLLVSNVNRASPG
jgi:hypothetical protein